MSRAEVVRRSIGVYDWVIEQLASNKEVLLRDTDGEIKGVILEPGLFPSQRARSGGRRTDDESGLKVATSEVGEHRDEPPSP
ncbi:MAG: hypothetical protein AAB417_00475 [Patescibacteria group bacterium]